MSDAVYCQQSSHLEEGGVKKPERNTTKRASRRRSELEERIQAYLDKERQEEIWRMQATLPDIVTPDNQSILNGLLDVILPVMVSTTKAPGKKHPFLGLFTRRMKHTLVSMDVVRFLNIEPTVLPKDSQPADTPWGLVLAEYFVELTLEQEPHGIPRQSVQAWVLPDEQRGQINVDLFIGSEFLEESTGGMLPARTIVMPTKLRSLSVLKPGTSRYAIEPFRKLVKPSSE
jgi:hypothetical protein